MGLKRMGLSCVLWVFITLPLCAREEIVLTIPKAGTHYLVEIINHFPGTMHAFAPVMPEHYRVSYDGCLATTDRIPTTHTFPSVLNLSEVLSPLPTLLLIRDPRDVVLSLMEYIPTGKWGGKAVKKKWKRLTKFQQKVEFLLKDSNWPQGHSILSALETAVQLIKMKKIEVFRYEDLNPSHENSSKKPVREIIRLGAFFGLTLSETEAERILKEAFLNPTGTLNTAYTRKYTFQISKRNRDFLTERLKKYIELLGYPL